MAQVIPPGKMLELAGRQLGSSDWLTITQDRINVFADATSDHQFIHVDPERAAQTPQGTTIAHGFLSLSLISFLVSGLGPAPEGHTMTYNYGLNKVRFLNPVKVNSRVRAHVKIQAVTEKKPGQLLMISEVTVEIEGEEKPALFAESLAMIFYA